MKNAQVQWIHVKADISRMSKYACKSHRYMYILKYTYKYVFIQFIKTSLLFDQCNLVILLFPIKFNFY